MARSQKTNGWQTKVNRGETIVAMCGNERIEITLPKLKTKQVTVNVSAPKSVFIHKEKTGEKDNS